MPGQIFQILCLHYHKSRKNASLVPKMFQSGSPQELTDKNAAEPAMLAPLVIELHAIECGPTDLEIRVHHSAVSP